MAWSIASSQMFEVVKTVLAWIGLGIIAVGFGGMVVIIFWEMWLEKRIRQWWKDRQYSE